MGIIKKRSVSSFANKYRGLASDVGVTWPHPCHGTYPWTATRFHSAPNHCTLISNPQWPMPVALWAVATGQIGMKSHFLACQPSSSIRDNKQKNFQAGDATHGYSACKIYPISYFVHFEKIYCLQRRWSAIPFIWVYSVLYFKAIDITSMQ